MGSVYNRFGGETLPNLINKNITANGSYDAASDNADGYSTVNVNVNAARNLLWTGTSDGNVNVDLSGYDWVYIEVTGGSRLLLQVGGAVGFIGLIGPHAGYSAFGTARGYKATTAGIIAETGNMSATEVDSVIINVTAVYGITNIT